MHLSGFLLLPLLVAADQKPLIDKAQGWFDQAKAYMEGSVPSPIDAGAAKVADLRVQKINQRNWERVLAPKLEGPEEWLLYITGGNKTCYGRCDPFDEAWNLSIPLISALPNSPHLASLDCEKDGILCTAWGAAVPNLWHFSFPQKPNNPAVPTPHTPLHIVEFNTSAPIKAQDFVKIVMEKEYLEREEYKGVLQPIDGLFRQYGMLIPLGYVLWGFGSTPSWLVLVGISFFSRQYMSRKAQGKTTPFSAGQPPVAPRAQPAAARPASAGQGGGKKRK